MHTSNPLAFLCASPAEDAPASASSDIDAPNSLVVPITSDKGLCGGINTTVVKYVRQVNNILNLDGMPALNLLRLLCLPSAALSSP